MITIETTRFWRKTTDRKLRRRTTTASEDQAIVVLDGRHGRYVFVYDERIGCELSVSEDVTLIRDDQDFSSVGGGVLKRWRAERVTSDSHPAPSSSLYPVRDAHQTLDLATTRAQANRLATTLITKQKPFTVQPVFMDGGVPAWEFTIVEDNEPSKHEAA